MRSDFGAMIGHRRIGALLRVSCLFCEAPRYLPSLPKTSFREILPWIPPRTVCRGVITSSQAARPTAFTLQTSRPIAADRGDLARVRQAVQCAIRSGRTNR